MKTELENRLEAARKRYAELEANRHESYRVLPDNTVEIDCEFGKWIFGGPWRSGVENERRARGVVSTLRYNAHWARISPFDVSREQD